MVETAAPTARVEQPALAVAADPQGAQALARVSARQPAEHDELVFTLAFDFDPIVAAPRPGAVRRVLALGDHAFEALALAKVVERSAVAFEVIERSYQTPPLHELQQQLLALQ